MEARKTDEIICANCGRPNLEEAEKCWYCQTPLVKDNPADTADEEAAESVNEPKQPAAQEPKSQPTDPGEDIPDWLKRVRELKAQDYPEEEDEDQWQQQGLFGGTEEKPASKTSRKPHKKADQSPGKVTNEKPENEEPQPTLDISQHSEPLHEEEKEKSKPEEDPSSDELPDGFIQFRPKSN